MNEWLYVGLFFIVGLTFTGRICPAPSETACVLGINQPAITIEEIEKHIIEIAFEKGFVLPKKPNLRSGKKVAVIGSGPAGLAAAAQLNYAGHSVTVFERDDAPGGLLRYGIPDFKLEKWVIDRRIKLMEEEGIIFKCLANVGVNVSINDILKFASFLKARKLRHYKTFSKHMGIYFSRV